MIRRILCVALLAALAGCASSGSGNRSLQSRNLITAAEVQAIHVTTVYEAIMQLRPHFLQTRGQASIRDPSAGEPVVYVNGVRYGGTKTLQGMRAMDVAEIRFLSASDATTRYGTGHVGGVIEVRTRG
ncbi:MAG: TonB-dependent receptor plug domain-containing protein [Longimicrobiales bacterium]